MARRAFALGSVLARAVARLDARRRREGGSAHDPRTQPEQARAQAVRLVPASHAGTARPWIAAPPLRWMTAAHGGAVAGCAASLTSKHPSGSGRHGTSFARPGTTCMAAGASSTGCRERVTRPMRDEAAAPVSDVAPWTASHDWKFSPLVMASFPPQYKATCRRCGEKQSGRAEVFQRRDCTGRVTS